MRPSSMGIQPHFSCFQHGMLSITLQEKAGDACANIYMAPCLALQALSVIRPLAPLNSVDGNLSEVLDFWMAGLYQQPYGEVSSRAALQQSLVQAEHRQQWPRLCIWSALKTVLRMLEVRTVRSCAAQACRPR